MLRSIMRRDMAHSVTRRGMVRRGVTRRAARRARRRLLLRGSGAKVGMSEGVVARLPFAHGLERRRWVRGCSQAVWEVIGAGAGVCASVAGIRPVCPLPFAT